MSDKASKAIADWVCAGCGCGCDDVALAIHGTQVEAPASACKLERDWVTPVADEEPVARLKGVESTLEAAMAHGVELLQSAKAPLVYGLTYATCEAQKAAIDLAESIGGTLDIAGAGRDLEGTAIQNVGAVTATLGELRDRADFVLLWNAAPMVTNPRFLERYLPGRTYVLVADDAKHLAATDAERTILVKKGAEASAVSVLRGLVRGKSLDEEDTFIATGVKLDEWKWLAERMKAAHYGTVILPPRGTASVGRRLDLSLAQLVRELNEQTRFVACRLTAGNAAGAIQTLVARTGFPCCVNFSRGYPRFDPAQYDAALQLEMGEADLVVFVGDEPPPRQDAKAWKTLSGIPSIYLDSRPTAFHRQASVAFLTARPGVQCPGTFFRLDSVALPLRQIVSTKRQSDAEILAKLVRALRSAG